MTINIAPSEELFGDSKEFTAFKKATNVAMECYSLYEKGEKALETADEKEAIGFCSYAREQIPFVLGNLGFTSADELTKSYQSEFGLESITSTNITAIPFTGCKITLESLDEIIMNIITKIKNFIVYIVKKIGAFISSVINSLKFITSGAEELKTKLIEVNKEKTMSKQLDGLYAEKLLTNIQTHFPTLIYFSSGDIVNSAGINNIGRNILALGSKETKLDYPFLGDLPIGDKKQFANAMISFYKNANINSTGKVVKDSKCIEDNIISELKIDAKENERVVRVYNADMKHLYYVALWHVGDDPLKVKFGKLQYNKMDKPLPAVGELTPSSINSAFDGDIFHFTIETLNIVIKNTDAATRAIRSIPDKVTRLKRDLDKVLENRSVVNGEKEISKNLAIYSTFCNNLFSVYFNDSIKSAIGTYSDLYKLSKLLFTTLIGDTQAK